MVSFIGMIKFAIEREEQIKIVFWNERALVRVLLIC